MSARRGVDGSVPDFGRLLDRPRLIGLLEAAPPGLSLLVAPSGYGKSVLAAQFAKGSPNQGLWLDFAGCADDGVACLERVVDVVAPQPPASSPSLGRPALLRRHPEDLVESIAREVLSESDPTGLRVVLDDVPVQEASALEALSALAKRLSRLGVRTVGTMRRLPSGTLGAFEATQILDFEDLRLTVPEASDLAARIVGEPVSGSDASSIRDACGGHPAMFSVLVRHAIVSGGSLAVKSSPSLDLRSQLISLSRVATDASGRQALFIAALLGKGSLQDLAYCGLTFTPSQLGALEAAMPLMSVNRKPATGLPDSFMLHDLAGDVFLSEEFLAGLGLDVNELWRRAVRILVGRQDLQRSLMLVERMGSASDLIEWLRGHGAGLLLQGGANTLSDAMNRLSVSEYVQHPDLLLLQAQAHQERSELREAIGKARVVRTISERDNNPALEASSLLLCGQCYVDTGDYESAFSALTELLSGSHETLTPDQLAWTYAALGVSSMYMGLGEDALVLTLEARRAASRPGISEGISVFVTASAGAISALVKGDFAGSLVHFAKACEASHVPSVQLAKAQGNLGVTLCEMGRLERSVDAVRESLRTCLEAESGLNRGAFLPVEGAAVCGLGATESGLALMREGIELSLAAGDRHGASYNRTYLATALRAAGHVEESVSQAEQALEFFSGLEASSQQELATLEFASSLLALGDIAAAVRMALTVQARMSGLNAYHKLRADMILAEADRRLGRQDEAVARLAKHEEHVLSESSNWQIAMYCRAFPNLLGLFALAIDIDQMPAHLVRMILPENAERALEATRDWLDPAVWTRMGQRLLGDDGFTEYLNRGGRPICRVRLFGGLEVNVGGRIVGEREWRKRKARLLFAMLVIRRGQDVPRDQILEHLWPEMEEARAKNNMYVIWSAMKSALSPEAGKNDPCPYIENAGGVCRVVVDSVRSDVEEFERTLSAAREATADGRQSEALRHYELLADIYRGELLPGDVYDDWFAQMRDEFRAKYADAMLQAASILQGNDDPLGALTFVRRALSQDSLREDLYQAAMRCQIAARQRNEAIQTYLQCRTRLSEDLGLDPSAETRALYDQILGMEDTPRSRRGSWGH